MWEREWGGDVQMGVASEWVGLSMRRVLGFGGRVRGVVNGLCHGLTNVNGWTMCKWESLRTGWACPWGDSGFRWASLWGKERMKDEL